MDCTNRTLLLADIIPSRLESFLHFGDVLRGARWRCLHICDGVGQRAMLAAFQHIGMCARSAASCMQCRRRGYGYGRAYLSARQNIQYSMCDRGVCMSGLRRGASYKRYPRCQESQYCPACETHFLPAHGQKKSQVLSLRPKTNA
jgi:hypothetical protein